MDAICIFILILLSLFPIKDGGNPYNIKTAFDMCKLSFNFYVPIPTLSIDTKKSFLTI